MRRQETSSSSAPIRDMKQSSNAFPLEKFRDLYAECSGKICNLGIGHASNAAFDPGQHFPRNIPAETLALRRQFSLRHSPRSAETADSLTNNISRRSHSERPKTRDFAMSGMLCWHHIRTIHPEQNRQYKHHMFSRLPRIRRPHGNCLRIQRRTGRPRPKLRWHWKSVH